jgi:hypothetical protein
MSELTNEQKVQVALDAAIPTIVENLKRELIQNISWQVKNDVQKQVTEVVSAWFAENMVQEILTILVDSKLGLLGSIIPFAEQLSQSVTDGLMQSVTANLATTYKRDKIMEALFK